jgi:hypothetical protein
VVTYSAVSAGGLSLTNVEPATLSVNATGTATVTFTTASLIPIAGKIKVTFGAGFNVSGAASGTCSTMDGSFATGVSGQNVTITRSSGTIQSAAAEICTIASIVNPSSAGSTGVYAIYTQSSNSDTIDSDTAVAADTIVGGARRRILQTSFNDFDPLWQEAMACVDPDAWWKVTARPLECSM